MSYFQVLDHRGECNGIYLNDKLVFNQYPSNLTKTWEYSKNLLNHQEYEYGYVYSGGTPLLRVCPRAYEADFRAVENKMKSYITSFEEAQINLDEFCLYELLPPHFLKEFFSIRDFITRYVFSKEPLPNYEFLRRIYAMICDISCQSVNVDREQLSRLVFKETANSLIKKVSDDDNYIDYDMFKTVTGRLTTRDNSFPILTLSKELRYLLKPKNDFFIEIDYNAAELRTFLSLLGESQPEEDIHDWNREIIFKQKLTRNEIKQKTFGWFYSNRRDEAFEKIYDKEKIKELFWKERFVTTPFNRKIESDEFHAVNYAVQSANSDNFLEAASNLHEFLKPFNSSIAFLIHDSLVLDFSQKDLDSLPEMIRIMKDTRLGRFMVNVSAGPDFGNLEKLETLK
jgi:hypothetical protein